MGEWIDSVSPTAIPITLKLLVTSRISRIKRSDQWTHSVHEPSESYTVTVFSGPMSIRSI